MKEFTKIIQSIFQLNSSVENIFFKDFMQAFEMPKGINSTHMRTLLILNFRGSCPMSDISHILTLEKGSFTPVANKLIKLGYIAKEQSESDRRVYNLSLTEEGRAIAMNFANKHTGYMEDLLSNIDEATQDDFVNYVDGILQILGQIPGKEIPQFPPKGPLSKETK